METQETVNRFLHPIILKNHRLSMLSEKFFRFLVNYTFCVPQGIAVFVLNLSKAHVVNEPITNHFTPNWIAYVAVYHIGKLTGVDAIKHRFVVHRLTFTRPVP